MSKKNLVRKIRKESSGKSNQDYKNEEFRRDFKDLINGAKRNIRANTVDYLPNFENYQRNKNRAMIGFGTGFFGSFFSPIIGIAGLTYGGIKAYQAHKDKGRR